MKTRTWQSYARRKNLLNRFYNMLNYFDYFNINDLDEKDAKRLLVRKMNDIYFLETFAKFLEQELKKNKNKIELKCNIKDLIDDINYLKQYLEKQKIKEE